MIDWGALSTNIRGKLHGIRRNCFRQSCSRNSCWVGIAVEGLRQPDGPSCQRTGCTAAGRRKCSGGPDSSAGLAAGSGRWSAWRCGWNNNGPAHRHLPASRPKHKRRAKITFNKNSDKIQLINFKYKCFIINLEFYHGDEARHVEERWFGLEGTRRNEFSTASGSSFYSGIETHEDGPLLFAHVCDILELFQNNSLWAGRDDLALIGSSHFRISVMRLASIIIATISQTPSRF